MQLVGIETKNVQQIYQNDRQVYDNFQEIHI